MNKIVFLLLAALVCTILAQSADIKTQPDRALLDGFPDAQQAGDGVSELSTGADDYIDNVTSDGDDSLFTTPFAVPDEDTLGISNNGEQSRAL